jgi:hypothetical protein
MRVCVGLITWRRVLNPGFLASYCSAGFDRFLPVSALASHWLEDGANFTPTSEKITNTAPTTLSAIQASCQIDFYQ